MWLPSLYTKSRRRCYDVVLTFIQCCSDVVCQLGVKFTQSTENHWILLYNTNIEGRSGIKMSTVEKKCIQQCTLIPLTVARFFKSVSQISTDFYKRNVVPFAAWTKQYSFSVNLFIPSKGQMK